MKIKDKVLIVEDEQSISNFISMILTANGYDTIIVRSGEEALTMISSHCPDLIVLDLGLPDMDGLEVLKSVRKWSNLPVVVVSARTHEHDKVEALDYGADDYLVKPFAFEELLARLRVLLRKPAGDKTSVLQVGDLQLRLDTRQVFRGGQALQLSSKEFSLLRYMMQNAGIVLSRDTLEQHVWDYDYSGGSNVIDVYIRYLRRKIDEGHEKKYIHTVRGCGYVLKDDAV